MENSDIQSNYEGLDILFEEEQSNRSLIINYLLKKKRISFEEETLNLKEKQGCIGDVLVNDSIRSGSLVWLDLRQNNSNEIKVVIENEIKSVLNSLENQSLITSSEIVEINLNGGTLSVSLKIDNQQPLAIVYS